MHAFGFISAEFLVYWDIPSYREGAYASADFKKLYRLERSFLQHLQHRYRAKRWVLKSPGHMPYLAELVSIFPDALFVNCVRDPVKVVASMSNALGGGGFGRRVFGNDVRMVVAVARKYPGTPIHVIWSREETMRQGRYRPLNAVRLKAGLDEKGLPVALLARSVGKGMQPRGVSGLERPGFSTAFGLFAGAHASGLIPNSRVEWQDLPLHLIAGPYRGPGYNSNTFILESFIDECAHAAGIDPLEYRLKLYSRWSDPGPTLCLREAAKEAKWGQPLERGRAQGLAIGNWDGYGQPQAGTTVCCVATVAVSRRGELKVEALDLAFDCGRVLNRDAVLTELQGGLIFGLNMSLNEALTVKNGRIVEGNFDTYPMLRMVDMPAIRVHFGGLSGHERFSEIGEPAVGVVGPAIANAIFRITGRRIRSTPIRQHELT